MEKVFASWSGGKDCCLALNRALSKGLDVSYLANMVSEDGQRSRSHGINASVLAMQSQAIGIPIVQQPTRDDEYEANFKAMLRRFKEEGVTGGVFGDIDFNEHRQWIERVCRDADFTPYLPLWLEDQNKLLGEFIDAGFKALVIATNAEVLGEEWLGRRLDRDFLAQLDELSQSSNLTVCGEVGEYHTLVVDGPVFIKRLEILKSEKVFREGHWFLDILKTTLV